MGVVSPAHVDFCSLISVCFELQLFIDGDMW